MARRSSAHKQRYARFLMEHPTHSEKKLWEALRQTEWGKDVLRQQRIAGWIADLHFVRQKLVIEVDGDIHRGRLLTDLHRDRVMEAHGFHVLRVPASLVLFDLPGVLTQIQLALHIFPHHNALPLGAQLLQNLHAKRHRRIPELQTLSQRMYLSEQLWYREMLSIYRYNATAFHQQQGSQPEQSPELWLSGWETLHMSNTLEPHTPDLLFARKQKPLAALQLYAGKDVERFFEQQRHTFQNHPYLTRIVPVYADFYRAEQPWYYGEPLPTYVHSLGQERHNKQRFQPHISSQSRTAEKRKALRAQTSPKAPPSTPPPQTHNVPQHRDGWPKDLHAFRIVDTYSPQGEHLRLLLWIVESHIPPSTFLLLQQGQPNPLAHTNESLAEAMITLQQQAEHFLQERAKHAQLDVPLPWQNLCPKQRKTLRKQLQMGYFPPRFHWEPAQQQWQQSNYEQQLQWERLEDTESTS